MLSSHELRCVALNIPTGTPTHQEKITARRAICSEIVPRCPIVALIGSLFQNECPRSP